MQITRAALAVLVALSVVAPARANDSVAAMGAGGLVLRRTDGIEMRSEDLYVSAREIRVQYVFFNRTDQDISTLVAFPMPDIAGRPEGDIGVSQTDPTMLTPFTTVVDGRRIVTNVEQRAFAGAVEHTDLLKGLGVPLSPHLPATTEALGRLPRPQIDQLIELGMVEDRSWDAAGEHHVDIAPLWTLRTTHYWTQVFPRGKAVAIDHRYTPAIGGSVGSPFGDPVGEASEAATEEAARYCTDDAFRRGARRMRARGLTLSETWVDYVLITGANWARPIGDFRLTVDKGASGNLVSFCGQGVRRTGGTTFGIHRKNYTPASDLSVLILTGVRPAR